MADCAHAQYKIGQTQPRTPGATFGVWSGAPKAVNHAKFHQIGSDVSAPRGVEICHLPMTMISAVGYNTSGSAREHR